MISRSARNETHKRTSGQRAARRWKRLSLLLAIMTTGACIGGFALLSATVNGLPPEYDFFDGQALLFQPATESTSDTINLEMDSDANGNHPFVQYTVFACGSQPYNAYLLLSKNAQVSSIKQISGPSGSASSPHVPTITETSPVPIVANTAHFGTYQWIRISMPEVPPCRLTSDTKVTSFEGMVEIDGFLQAPLQQNWSGPWGLWHGPHASQAWPVFGVIGGETGKVMIAGGRW